MSADQFRWFWSSATLFPRSNTTPGNEGSAVMTVQTVLMSYRPSERVNALIVKECNSECDRGKQGSKWVFIKKKLGKVCDGLVTDTIMYSVMPNGVLEVGKN